MTTWRGEEPKGKRGERMWESREQRRRGGASSPSYSGLDLWGGEYLAIARKVWGGA